MIKKIIRIFSCTPNIKTATKSTSAGSNLHLLYTHTHNQTHKHTRSYVLFTYPQLEVNKGEAEDKPASTLLTVSVSQGENILVVQFFSS